MNRSSGTAYEGLITALEGHGSKVKKLNARESMVQCPAHADKNPSLHVTDSDGKVLLYCHAGCAGKSILDALGLDDEALFDEKGKTREITDEYDYIDEEGELRLQVVRFYPKSFAQRRPMPGGQWAWNLHGVTPILFHLQEVLAAEDIVYYTEGEKDALRLMAEGVVATTSPMGAGKWRDDYAQSLIGKRVVIIADRDESGYAHADRVADSLRAAGITHKIVQAKTGKDVSNHLDAGHTLEELEPATGLAPTVSTRRLPGRHEGLAEIFIDNLHVIATKPARNRWGRMASKVWPTITVMGKALRFYWRVEVEIESASGRTSMTTALGRMGEFEKGEAAGLIERLFIELGEWADERNPLIHVGDYPDLEETGPGFLFQPWLPATGSTVIAGTRATKKSYLALAIAASVSAGQALIHTHKPGWAEVKRQARTLYLDWESEVERIVPRVRALHPDAQFLYSRERKPLVDGVDALIETIRNEGIEFVVIDSLSASIGASMNDDETGNQFWDAVSALAIPALVIAHKSADASRTRARRVFGSMMHEARPRVIWNIEVATEGGYMVMECFKDSDYGLDGIKTAWDVEFTTPGEFQAPSRVYFNPIDPNSVVLDEDEEERPRRRGERQLNDPQTRRVLLRTVIDERGGLTAADAYIVLESAGMSTDLRRIRDDLAWLERNYDDIVSRDVPSAGGRPAVIYEKDNE